MTLGSLFDGSGGFPLAGMMAGIEPRWLSEIEPFPILVTHRRFPCVQHYGDVSKLSGAELEPVDVITFGSPCQDLSIAGARAGLHEGERSSLFFQAVRIIKEMREKTNGECPRYAVWENVPGAFSSNKGRDFQAVLESLCKIKDGRVSIPMSEKRWENAGAIMGDGYSLAWRVLDAQFWGVPQRRKRIFLVADFGGDRAGEILFKPESLSGYSPAGFEAWERTPSDAERGVGGSDRTCFAIKGNFIDRETGQNGIGWSNGKMYTLDATDRHAVCYDAPEAVQTFDVKISSDGTKNWRAHAYCTDICRALDTGGANPDSNHGGIIILNDQGGAMMNVTVNVTGTLRAQEHGHQPIVFDARGNGDHEKRITDYTALAVSVGNGQLHQISMEPTANALDCMHDQQAILTNGQPPRKYIVRRLTPTECARLQGFPDWWCDGLADPDPSENEVAFWMQVWREWSELNGKKTKTERQIRKWLADPHTDSAEYKMWGNGVALPCVAYVMAGIAGEKA